ATPTSAVGASRLQCYMEVTKARLSALVVFTTAVGYVAAVGWSADWVRLLCAVVGTALAAGCASVLNQMIERDRDRSMNRTQDRPLPSGMMSMRHASVLAILLGAGGLTILAAGTNIMAMLLAAITIVLYAGIYTPAKVISPINTLIGAVCGAIPPMIGWVAATDQFGVGAWILGALLFIWQLPHFFALAWMYRDDYARGGFRMLPSVDDTGRWTGGISFATSAILIPIGIIATMTDVAGVWFLTVSVGLGLWMTWLAWRFMRQRDHQRARSLFLASITYLPLLLAVLLIEPSPTSQNGVEPAETIAQVDSTRP
ncbi:MAG: heme o synthase, partial [Planctomycetota bacterium]